MPYSVQPRAQELGVRMALGPQASNLRNLVMRRGMTLTFMGVLIGGSGAFWLTYLLADFLFAGAECRRPILYLDACNQGFSGRCNGCAANRMSVLRQYVDTGRKVLR
jgi:ABC-type antimicrobial peptide transport system permease subunit